MCELENKSLTTFAVEGIGNYRDCSQAMSCRTGPLRAGGGYFVACVSCLVQAIFCGPPVGRMMMIPTNGRACALILPRPVYPSRS